jgi:histidine triad (HIT) family protein
MLTDEQAQKIKTHLLEQLENFPEEQRKIIKHKILSMNNEEMEIFLKENNLNNGEKKPEELQQRCIFCSIIKKEIKSYTIAENKEYIGILELNPLSKGHTLIVPKEHYNLDKIPENAIEFAKEVSSNIFNKLKPKDIQFQKNEVLGHANLEIIPVYDEEKQERHRASESELSELFNLLNTIKNDNASSKSPEKTEQKVEENKIETLKEEPKIELPKIKPRIKWI